MRRPRLTVLTAIFIVAIAAVDLTAIRAIFGGARTFGLGLQSMNWTLPMGLALNLGLVRIVHARGRNRAFWAGFLVCGTIATATAAWAALTPAGSARSPTGGPNVILHGSTAWRVWSSYFSLVVNSLEVLGMDPRSFAPRSLDNPGIGYILIVGFMTFAPQLATALAGGLVARWMVPRDAPLLRPHMPT